jgi:pimeloyl-ACP methyl ester carboxylesterase
VSELPAPSFIDIGGRRIAAVAAGEGSPSVVLLSGLGLELRLWRRVLPAVAGFTRALVFDRAGAGVSDPPAAPRGMAGLAEELQAVLDATATPAPYVLVAHSLAAHVARVFAARHPGEIAGLLLLDPQHEDSWDRIVALIADGAATYAHAVANVREHRERVDLATIQADLTAAGPLPAPSNVPLVIISRGLPDEGQRFGAAMGLEERERFWRDLQGDLAVRLGARRHLVAERSRHLIPRDEPELVVEAIGELVEETRLSQRAEATGRPS